MTPKEMALTIGNGLLSFPVTPFDASNKFDAARYRSNLDWLCSYEVAGLFAAGGTGGFFSLTPAGVLRGGSTAAPPTARPGAGVARAGYRTAIGTRTCRGVRRTPAQRRRS